MGAHPAGGRAHRPATTCAGGSAAESFVLQAFVGPIVLAAVVSLAFGGSFGLKAKIGVVAADRSPVAVGLQDQLIASSGHGLTFSAVPDSGRGPARVDDGHARRRGGHPRRASRRRWPARTPVAVQVVAGAEHQIGRRGLPGRRRRVRGPGRTRCAWPRSRCWPRGGPPPIRRRSSRPTCPCRCTSWAPGSGCRRPPRVGPGMGLLFLFLSVSTVARSLLEERRLRVLDRIRSAPVSFTSILLGKCAGLVLVGCVSMTVLWGATAALLGAHWGAPGAVVLLIVASSLAVAGVGRGGGGDGRHRADGRHLRDDVRLRVRHPRGEPGAPVTAAAGSAQAVAGHPERLGPAWVRRAVGRKGRGDGHPPARRRCSSSGPSSPGTIAAVLLPRRLAPR